MIDAAPQVWLDVQNQPGQIIVVPYVKSARDIQLKFRMDVIYRGEGNTSRVSQQGTVNAEAATPTALANVKLGSSTHGDCDVELALHEGVKEIGTFHFNCMKP